MHKILIADDDDAFRGALCTLLESKGYAVLTAPNGADAYRLAKSESPDLVLLDVMMTYDSEGLDVARKLHEDPATRSLPVICVSGIRKAKDLGEGLKPDADWLPVFAVLEKPVKPDLLLRTIKGALAAR